MSLQYDSTGSALLFVTGGLQRECCCGGLVGQLEVTPSAAQTIGPLRPSDSETDSVEYSVTNTGDEGSTVDWTITAAPEYGWVNIAPLSGDTTTGETDTVTVNIDSTGVSAGYYPIVITWNWYRNGVAQTTNRTILVHVIAFQSQHLTGQAWRCQWEGNGNIDLGTHVNEYSQLQPPVPEGRVYWSAIAVDTICPPEECHHSLSTNPITFQKDLFMTFMRLGANAAPLVDDDGKWYWKGYSWTYWYCGFVRWTIPDIGATSENWDRWWIYIPYELIHRNLQCATGGSGIITDSDTFAWVQLSTILTYADWIASGKNATTDRYWIIGNITTDHCIAGEDPKEESEPELSVDYYGGIGEGGLVETYWCGVGDGNLCNTQFYMKIKDESEDGRKINALWLAG